MKNKTIPLLLGMLLLLSLSAYAFPPIAAEFYGNLTINSEQANISTNISILDSSGTQCGTHLTRYKGIYGLLSCNGDDPDTSVDEGALPGEKLYFYVNSVLAAESIWQEGIISSLNISVIPTRQSRSIYPIYIIALAFILTCIGVYFYTKRI